MIFNNNKNIKSNTFFDEDKFKNHKIFNTSKNLRSNTLNKNAIKQNNLLLDESSVKNIFVKL